MKLAPSLSLSFSMYLSIYLAIYLSIFVFIVSEYRRDGGRDSKDKFFDKFGFGVERGGAPICQRCLWNHSE